MGKSSLLAVALCAAAVVGLGAGSAFAGEITGNGKSTPINEGQAASICSFSGQNDGNPPPGRTQSYGTNVAAGQSDPSSVNPGAVGQGVFSFHPGFACNGEHGFFAG